jgi:hypothetical protein
MWLRGATRFGKQSVMRGALRFMGPWGFAAWAVWTIVDWQLDKQKQVAIAAEATLNNAIKEDMSESEFQSFLDNDELFGDFEFKDGPIAMDISGQGAVNRDKAIKARVKELMTNRTAEQIEFIKRGLIAQGGWSEGKLNTILKEIGYDEENAERALARAAFTKMIKKPTFKQKVKSQTDEEWMLLNNPGYALFKANQAIQEKQTAQRNLFNRANNLPIIIQPSDNSVVTSNVSYYVEGYQAAEAVTGVFPPHIAHASMSTPLNEKF